MGKPEAGWILEQELCEDFDQEQWSSNLYKYWKSLHGLSNARNIDLTDWRLKELAKIKIFPNQAEVVKKVENELSKRVQNKVDDYKQELIACKEAVLNAMADEADVSEDEEDDLFKDF